MLIEDGVLNIKEFKTLFPNLAWKSAPRWAGKEREDVFYIARYEDDLKIVEISVRPSKRMKINESFKNYTIKGTPVTENYTGTIVNWGTTVEVVVDDKFIEEIKKISIPTDYSSKIQKISW